MSTHNMFLSINMKNIRFFCICKFSFFLVLKFSVYLIFIIYLVFTALEPRKGEDIV